MLSRSENGKLRFDCLGFRILLDDMTFACKTKEELVFLLNNVESVVQGFVEEAEEEWEQGNK